MATKFNPWIIGVVVAMAAFMEVLDTSIANVALPYMAGNLGASDVCIGDHAIRSPLRMRGQPWSLIRLAPALWRPMFL